MKRYILGIDFDGTIVVHKFPRIGDPVPGALTTIRELQNNGHEVFLWTMRGYQDNYPNVLEDAKSYLRRNGIEMDGYNESPAQFSSSNKQYAHLYIDDAAIGCPVRHTKFGDAVVDWKLVARELLDLGLISGPQYDKVYREVEGSDMWEKVWQ